ncbi:DUF5412 family protein [Ectobacillus ponti]|uniref:DUF5412 domain-containing protein n=1 Tax=Ectobacillus ponti TaxID=2961894 RepID=A0AA42BSG7_9BACI|nr:DUF5412 family protein [Ectobacillus ponti]MCP8968428.1 DUF5412 domain-containing protein [Ectobacillus ponti]
MDYNHPEIKKTKRKVGIVLLGITVSLVGVLYWAFYSMYRLPTGEKIAEVKSPDGTYTLRAYLSNGGATTSYAIRGELVWNNRTYFKTKNVYWNYREENATIVWQDKDTVAINGHTLDMPNEVYDFRKQ